MFVHSKFRVSGWKATIVTHMLVTGHHGVHVHVLLAMIAVEPATRPVEGVLGHRAVVVLVFSAGVLVPVALHFGSKREKARAS